MKYFWLLILFSFSSLIYSQQQSVVLTGNLNLDTEIALQRMDSLKTGKHNSNYSLNKKSPFLAGVLSFAVPGAGSFYVGEYWKSAIYLGVEAAGIAIGIIYNNKGDDQTAFFQNFANQHWNVKRYASWTLANAQKINPNLDVSGYKVFNSNGNVNWNELNRLESAVGSYYSHRLAHLGEQQYYEMIGKYTQFNVGWDDFGDDVNKEYLYGDPVTQRFNYYSEQRGKANNYYDAAKWGVITIVVNHIVSAFESAWSASRYNKTLEMNVAVDQFNLGYFVEYFPKFNLKIHF